MTSALKIFTRKSFSNSLVSTVKLTAELCCLLRWKDRPAPKRRWHCENKSIEQHRKRKMAARNCSSPSNNSDVPNACTENINDKVPLSPTDKIAAFSIVYGVIFLVSVVGKWQTTDRRIFYEFPSKEQFDSRKIEIKYFWVRDLRRRKHDRVSLQSWRHDSFEKNLIILYFIVKYWYKHCKIAWNQVFCGREIVSV